MAVSWRPFMISAIDSRMPPLLISTIFTADSYKIYLTDLAHLWCEDLDRRSILRRSIAEDTNIDPSEDAGQLKLFLDKISLGLEGGKDVDLLLGLDSHVGKESSTGARNLEINMSIALPKPLLPLNWTVRLCSCPQSDFATHFTIPLLYAQNARLKELDSLVGLLRDKDNVIQKLVDKLEATGAELGHLFPGVAGKGGRKIPRRVVEEKVKGLEVFAQEQWRNTMRNAEAEDEHAGVKTIIQGAFTKNSPVGSLAHGAELPCRFEKWWDQLKDGAIPLSTPKDGGKIADAGAGAEDVKAEPTDADMDTTEDEGTEGQADDFQVAATPPSSSRKPTRKQELSDDDTDDSDDLGASQSQQHVTIRDSFPAPKEEVRSETKKIGAIGGAEKASKTATKMKPEAEPEPDPEPEPVARATRSHKQDDADDDETETEDEGTNAPSKPTTSQKKSPPKPAAKAAKKGGLGKIGGKKSDPPPVPASPSKEDAPDTQTSEPPPKATKSRLGRIGHKPPKEEPAADDESRGRTEAKEEEKPRETSEERAQRKREELKRQLEEKAKAPAKKKRKF
ncbi:hypothetical protein VC83_06398 [Pseudogymnoascus destructans]|uniref:Non-homologous end-joining factor 1 n=2 Tax=Pseudogymnoascus destructans TaxID=655981 RepID=L8GD29_PSED2|nr:uncharacterized protein VC83_06398 [Pseudogymnoascus destructans]ELR09996.1 hypothetical protein GMDG_00754 [Pseudogymnoascus destructans 20631-21]OAF58295.1 hypothetical protein VC83_06398 [Pseudogymnoascus destructans]